MGDELMQYRVSLGLFFLRCRNRIKVARSRRYTPFTCTSISDFRLCCMVCCTLILCAFAALDVLVYCHQYLVSNYSTTYVIVSSCCTNNTSRGTSHICSVHEYMYAAYSCRLLLLSADIELNPGPTEDTKLLLDAIQDVKNEIVSVKGDVKSVKTELQSIKTEMSVLRNNISQMEQDQTKIWESISNIDSRVTDIEYMNEVLHDDVANLSLHDELVCDSIERIEQQLYISKSERLKDSLRIFGLEETEDENTSLNSIISSKVFSKMSEDDKLQEGSIESSRRVGTVGDKPRLVIVKFRNVDDKFRLFKYRDQLRDDGIRISNDLSYLQRSETERPQS